ncbi:MAG: FkbM family methyltransferase [Candidatus Thorarchaeota archaeon]
MIKDKLLNRAQQLVTILENPSSLKARFSGCYFEVYNMLYKMKSMNIYPKTIIDVGANRGIFSKTANYLFKGTKIIAFEPLKECYDELKKLNKSIPFFECYNYAIGNKKEKGQIFKSSFDYSSSLLEMANLHKEAFPVSETISVEDIEIITLDEAFLNKSLIKPVLIKIDVQGYENFVIEGAAKTLEKTDIIICELSFHKMYNNQVLFDDINDQLKKLNFRFLGPLNELKHPKLFAILQMDGLFVKNNFQTLFDCL